MSQPAKNVISKDVEIKGTVVFRDELTSDGKIDGDILSSGTLFIGKNGSVQGDIQAAVVSILGIVNGNITVEQRCELRGNAQLLGDLDAPRMIIEEGATFVGRAKVQPSESHKASLSGQPAKAIEPPAKTIPQAKSEEPAQTPVVNQPPQ